MLQVAREPDVAPETGAHAAYPVSTVLAFAQFTGQPPSRLRAAAHPVVPLVSRISCIPASSRLAQAPGDRLHSCVGRSRGPSPVVRPGRCTPSRVVRPGRCTPSPGRPAWPTYPSPGRADLGGARGVLARGGWAGSWQRIDGVSRLLPYSDLLALTSSSRRGEGVSDRGSWKRLRILPTGHVDAHVEPDIETGAVLIGPAWCLDR